MINYFPTLYPDEILYSVISRYHFHSGNLGYGSTVSELYGKKNLSVGIYFSCHLNQLASNFINTNHHTKEYFLAQNTVFPYYSPFLTDELRRKIIDLMFYGKNGGLQIMLQEGGRRFSRQSMAYCYECVEEDIKKYGEPYFHRAHQLDGVHVCHEHGAFLNEYTTNKSNRLSKQFIRLEKEKIYSEEKIMEGNNLLSEKERCVLMSISKASLYILESDLTDYNLGKVYDKYRILLKNNGYGTINGHFNQVKLVKDLSYYFGENVLNLLQSNPNKGNSWIKDIVRFKMHNFPPIRHILFILFLCGDIRKFFEEEFSEVNIFGDGPWLCLNPVADHYKKPVVTNITVTKLYCPQKIVAKFQCSCGFIYCKNESDPDKISKINSYGHVWENRLKELILQGETSVYKLSKILNTDIPVVYRYANKLGLINQISRRKTSNISAIIENKNNQDYDRQYKNNIYCFVKTHPNMKRQEVRQFLQKEYAWLYKNDRCWLYSNLPPRITEINRKASDYYRTTWEERDSQLYDKVKTNYTKLFSQEKPIRITKSNLAEGIDKEYLIKQSKYSLKLPKTHSFVNDVLELLEDFQIRRIEFVAKQLYEKYGKVTRKILYKKASIHNISSCKIKEKIEEVMALYG